MTLVSPHGETYFLVQVKKYFYLDGNLTNTTKATEIFKMVELLANLVWVWFF